jgi:uncharacterized protein YutE (UPF0331/DUF86 family)
MLNEKLLEILKNLEIALKELKKRQGIQLQEYVKNRELQDIIEREFEKAIQDCIDIGARIISEKDFPSADTYGEIFEVLYKENVIDYNICEKMKELTGFRNVLVHIYRKIDNNEVLRHLKESLEFIEKFSYKIKEYIGL